MLFYRPHSLPSSYRRALADLLSSPNPAHRAVAINLERDHRVSEEREEAFRSFLGDPGDAEALRYGLVDYHSEEINGTHSPAFLGEENENNFVSGFGASGGLIDPDQELATVLDLTGLATHVYARARDEWRMPAFADLPVDFSSRGPDLPAWLDSKLEGQPAASVQAFVAASLEAIGRAMGDRPHQPSWATLWRDFELLARDQPVRWLETLGVSKPVAPRWLIVLRYRVREAGTLVRPTQLDAGEYFGHFPSPPEAALELGGHPMDLGWPGSASSSPEPKPVDEGGVGLIVPARAADRLPPEYVHQQIRHTVDHWIEGGRLCARLGVPTSTGLEAQRGAHRDRLRNIYSRQVLDWMPRVL